MKVMVAMCWFCLIFMASLIALSIAFFAWIDGEWVTVVLAFVVNALLIALLRVAPWCVTTAGEQR